MKNTIKMFGIIALVAVIGFSFASCDGGGGGGNGNGPPSILPTPTPPNGGNGPNGPNGPGVQPPGESVTLENKIVLTRYLDGWKITDFDCTEFIPVFDGEIPSMHDGYPVVAIGDWAFNTVTFTGLVIPNTVRYIGANAFSHTHLHTHIGALIIPDSVVTIGDSAFSGTHITSLKLGSSVETIGGGAFFGNELKELVIPDSVESIGDLAFAFNNFLESVIIPDSVESIGDSAFYRTNLLSTDNGITIPFANLAAADAAWGGTAWRFHHQALLYPGLRFYLEDQNFDFQGQ